ncbi:helix-turn-helix domain-containing protein [Paenibacillus sp. FSL K6-1558]|uniref:helix-turn-helix domain-containing protein n=1 Tax=Paenibacillus sp. FSL K6-1558 TaxID=2921473 RepID=UPI0030FC3DD4
MKLKEREIYRLKRLGKRIKSKDVAEYLGVHPVTISHFENRGNYMSKEKIAKYKEYIDNNKGSERL